MFPARSQTKDSRGNPKPSADKIWLHGEDGSDGTRTRDLRRDREARGVEPCRRDTWLRGVATIEVP